jgi:hypothetical protein
VKPYKNTHCTSEDIFKTALEKAGYKRWIGFSWLRIGFNGRLSWTW